MWSQRTIVALAPFLALQVPEVARAGPPEQLVQVAMHPTDPKTMVVRYASGGDGAVVTTDGGKSWKLLCNALLFDYVTTRGGPLTITGDGTTIQGVFTGMWHDDGHFCGWTSEPSTEGQQVAAFAVDPIDPALTYAVKSFGTRKGLLRRDASGDWSDLGTEEDLVVLDLHVTKLGGGRRIYMGAVKGQTTPPDGGVPGSNYVIRMSDDDGVTWAERKYGGADGTWHLQGVDPTDPDRLVVSIVRPQDAPPPARTTDTVLVSSDGGATFEEYLTITEVGGVAFAPDGRVWIGDAGAYDPAEPRGIWSAPNLGVPATQLSKADYAVQCLGYQSSTDTLYACQQSTFGPVDVTDGSFTTVLDLRRVGGFVDCTGVNMVATCKAQVCGAYCGYGHYAEAPVCCGYDTYDCGPQVATATPAMCNVGGTGGLWSGASAGGTAGSRKGGHGGCAVAVRARSGKGPAGAFVLVAMALALRVRLRPRRPARSGASVPPAPPFASLFGCWRSP